MKFNTCARQWLIEPSLYSFNQEHAHLLEQLNENMCWRPFAGDSDRKYSSKIVFVSPPIKPVHEVIVVDD